MKTLTIGKAVSGAAITALMLAGSSVAFAQTYANPDGTGSIVPTSSTSTVQPATGTGGTTTTGSGTTTTTPGIPNTGAGDPATWAVLGISAAIAAAGSTLLMRQRAAFR